MYLTSLEIVGFKSFGKKCPLTFKTSVTGIVGPNGSGKSNVADAFRFVLGEQSIKSLRGKKGEDLIWGGSSELPRANRASVKLTFDNAKRLLPVDFDEVVIERAVFRDGVNEYLINGSKVRLKDVSELLAGANLGSSGYHILSQGEADRALAASPRERKQMIEDALGLRVFQYKKEESIKKLEKTEENKKHIEALRKENAPHLAFLSRQLKKIEKARELKQELVAQYAEYLQREETFLTYEKEALASMREKPEQALGQIGERITHIREQLAQSGEGSAVSTTLLAYEKDLAEHRASLSEAQRRIGRIEGELAFEERRIAEEKKRIAEEEGAPVPYRTVRSFWEELHTLFSETPYGAEAEREVLQTLISRVHRAVERFADTIHAHKQEEGKEQERAESAERLMQEKSVIERESASIAERIKGTEQKVRDLELETAHIREQSKHSERELFSLMNEQTTLRAELARADMREETLAREREEFEREMREGVALIGRQILEYKHFVIPVSLDEGGEIDARSAQYERKRALEKNKIRLEELGGGGADEVSREYTEAKERDDFLERELADLTSSSQALHNLIADIDRELTERFKKGVSAIETQFSTFFTLMFGGGSARLAYIAPKKRVREELFVEEDSESEEGQEKQGAQADGIDIEVSLPKKRVQSLVMLSGGERALTSIAFIFAMSQVNPPPFLILDETDAALDEANSRRYGDMIQKLSEHSQLLLITHNRETMARAGMLYGVTMGMDGVSRTLSVQLGEATAHAK